MSGNGRPIYHLKSRMSFRENKTIAVVIRKDADYKGEKTTVKEKERALNKNQKLNVVKTEQRKTKNIQFLCR